MLSSTTVFDNKNKSSTLAPSAGWGVAEKTMVWFFCSNCNPWDSDPGKHPSQAFKDSPGPTGLAFNLKTGPDQ